MTLVHLSFENEIHTICRLFASHTVVSDDLDQLIEKRRTLAAVSACRLFSQFADIRRMAMTEILTSLFRERATPQAPF